MSNLNLDPDGTSLTGVLGRTPAASSLAWPIPPKAEAGV